MLARVFACECKYPQVERVLDPPGSGITEDCELKWVLGTKLRASQEQLGLLSPEPSFQPSQYL